MVSLLLLLLYIMIPFFNTGLNGGQIMTVAHAGAAMSCNNLFKCNKTKFPPVVLDK